MGHEGEDMINYLGALNVEDEYMANIDEISEKAFEDQCTTANPKLPLIEEIKDILKKAY